MKTAVDYMEEAPHICRTLIKEKDALIKPFVDFYTKKSYTRILLVACGSSYNIASTVRYLMEQLLHIEVKTVWPLTFVEYDHQFLEGSLIVCMTQSGKSTNTIRAVQKAQEKKADVCVLTMDAHTKLHELCEHVFWYGSDTEDYYVAKGFPVSFVYLSLFAIEAARRLEKITNKEYQQYYRDLQRAVDAMPKQREAAHTFYDENKEELGAMYRAMMVGLGDGFGIALEGALKINEMFGIPSNGYEMDEFLHGPCYEITKDHTVFLIDHKEITKVRMQTIYQGLHKLSDHIFLFTSNPDNVQNDKRVLYIDKDISKDFIILLYVLVFQLISDRLCLDHHMIAYTIRNYRFEHMVKTKA